MNQAWAKDVPTAKDAAVVPRPDLVHALMLHGIHVTHALVWVGPLPVGRLQAHPVDADARHRQHVLTSKKERNAWKTP